VAVTFVMVLATAATYPIYAWFLVPRKLAYLQTLVFILVIAALVQLVEIVLKKYVKSLYQALGVYLPLITTNCAVLGVTILHFEQAYNFGEALINSLGAGLGFLLAMVLFAGVRSRMESATITKSFEGVPITLIAASIVSLAFMGFSGMGA
jgi:electron transport complex protein RnfA